MSIYISSEADLVALVNAATGISFTVGELLFDLPQPTSASEQTTWGKNTKIVVRVAASSTKATGSQVIYYDRLDLTSLELYNLYGSALGENQALAAWLPVIKGFLNIPFTTSDLVDHSTTKVGGDVHLTLEAKSDSLGWVGDATLVFVGAPDISTAFANNELPGFN